MSCESFWRLGRIRIDCPRPVRLWYHFGRRHHNPPHLAIVEPKERQSNPRCILIACIPYQSVRRYEHNSFHCWPVADCPIVYRDPLYIWAVIRARCSSSGSFPTDRPVRIFFEPISVFISAHPSIT